jgi:hypothetical protein
MGFGQEVEFLDEEYSCLCYALGGEALRLAWVRHERFGRVFGKGILQTRTGEQISANLREHRVYIRELTCELVRQRSG